jgi:hypothetical protein
MMWRGVIALLSWLCADLPSFERLRMAFGWLPLIRCLPEQLRSALEREQATE